MNILVARDIIFLGQNFFAGWMPTAPTNDNISFVVVIGINFAFVSAQFHNLSGDLNILEL
jgi:hypothetical protein